MIGFAGVLPIAVGWTIGIATEGAVWLATGVAAGEILIDALAACVAAGGNATIAAKAKTRTRLPFWTPHIGRL